MVDIDLIRSKIGYLQNNLNRLKQKACITLPQLKDDLDAQDIVLHNLQLAIQICLDIGNHIIADESWEIPNSLGDIFFILYRHKVISSKMAETLSSMAGFRNLLIHEYEQISIEKVYDILRHRLGDFDTFCKELANYYNL